MNYNGDIYDIKQSYYKKLLTKRIIPKKRFEEIVRAYAILSNPKKRKRYDEEGYYDMDEQINEDSLNEEFARMSKEFSHLNKPCSNLNRGRDIYNTIKITAEEAISGCTKKIIYTASRNCTGCKGTGTAHKIRPSNCKYCGGTGLDLVNIVKIDRNIKCPECKGIGAQITNPCNQCNGTGIVMGQPVTLEAKIPKSTKKGDIIKLTGHGNFGARGGTPGDLYLNIDIQEDKIKIDNDIVYVKLPVNISTLILGGKVIVPTNAGERSLHIPPGTQPGQKFTLNGCGIVLNNNKRGNLVVEVGVNIPTTLSKEQRDLIESFSVNEKFENYDMKFE